MKCLILAAGYATRLYPLTENFPKPLLEVGGKPILDWLIEDLEQSGKISEYVIVSNHKFANIFAGWIASHPCREKMSLVDDGSISNDTRLGAVKDIQLGISERGIDEDLLVMAGDNLLTFSLKDYLDYFAAKKTTCIMRYWEPDTARLHKSGVAQVNEEGLILSMEEKPADPKSNWCCPPFYIYRREDLPLIEKGIADGCGTDAPGSFIAWLCATTPVHAWEMPGERLDIGSLETYEQAKRRFE
ncbi:MAG: nucleotidyltransferase family protein [Bacteroidales bacterium]|nr:nucleotidyltransferase family protein [Bacteroidales bacterium]